MLSKDNRIKKKKDFELIFKNSKNFKNNFFILKIAKNDLGVNRFGFVISKKVSKKAVIRNKIRRRLSEAVKVEINNIKAGMDLILIVLPGAEKKDFYEIKEAVKNAFVKINKNV
jgi:ribonuclease P protein component